jgi:hypothetical protein
MFLKKSQKPKAKNHKSRGIIKNVFFVLCFLFFQFASIAQCAMCRAALAGEGNVAKAKAVNNGIVYLMVIPYLLVAGVFYAVYRMRKNK